MPAIRHLHRTPIPIRSDDSSTPSPPTDQVSDDCDSLLICTCPSSPPPDNTPPITSENIGTSEKKRGRRVRRVKNEDHIPRPRNAFIIFRSHYINFLKSKDGSSFSNVEPLDEKDDSFVLRQRNFKKPKSSSSSPSSSSSSPASSSAEYQQNELSKIAAKVWNNMDTDERKPYSEEARKEKEWHKKMYPDYVYRAPNSAGPGGEKVKRFKIKVKMGNPSKQKRDSNGGASPSSGDSDSFPDLLKSSLAAPFVPSDGEVEVVGQWHQEKGQYDDDQQPQQYLLETHIGAEHEFVPTERIPSLELCTSRPIEQECQEEVDMKLRELCPTQQSTFAVDLGPRSLAYDQYQAKDGLSLSTTTTTGYSETLVDSLIETMGYEYGITEPFGFGGFGSNEAAFVPISTSFKFDEEVQPIDDGCSISNVSTVSYPGGGEDSVFSFFERYDLGVDNVDLVSSGVQAFQVGSSGLDNKFMDFDLEVPDFEFEMPMHMMMDRIGDDGDDGRRGFAAWAGYE